MQSIILNMIPYTGDAKSWNKLIAGLPLAHLLQTWEWSKVKSKNGWEALPFYWEDQDNNLVAAAMVHKRSLSNRWLARKICVMYVPKGPLLDWGNKKLLRQVLQDLKALAKKHGAILLKIDADVAVGRGVPGQDDSREIVEGEQARAELELLGWRFSPEQIQFPNTVLIDLELDENELLMRMKQKTRYNLRLAQKKGVKIRAGTQQDHAQIYRMYTETSIRDDFAIREEGYYQTVWDIFKNASFFPLPPTQPFCEQLIAEVDGEMVAAMALFYFARQAIYLFGMSRNEHRDKMPNYLLQWEAICRAKAVGCKVYNLWGAPNQFDDSDTLWGVYRFKEGFGGYVARTIGAWDFTPHPIIYKAYGEILPHVLEFMRRRDRAQARHILEK